MKICWDNLEKLEYRPDRGEWQKGKTFYVYRDSCQNCKEPFLAQKNNKNLYCAHSCSNSGKHHPNYGRKHPHISEKMLGEKNIAKRTDIRKKISKNLKKLYNEYPEKHSSSNLIYLEKLRKLMQGENNPAWKGGIAAEPYCDVWLDKDFKESIKERDGYQCLNPACSKEIETFCIHHINYIKKDCKPFNLITLCVSCNSKANVDREWHEAWYSTIIHNRYGEYKWQ